MNKDFKIAVIGLGYVGLPLAVEFAKHYNVVGLDKNLQRIKDLQLSKDLTGEVCKASLETVKSSLCFTNNESDISSCNVFIITVPTPVSPLNEPDFKYLQNASKTVSKFLKQDDFVIYESTVYPGATREICVPILQNNSKLKLNEDFYVGYSPERINPGDKERTITNITKIVSGSNDHALKIIDELYSSIIKEGTHRVSSIEAAEAAKVIENTQRDLNIALVNELSLIFNLIGLDTKEVIDAAATKWNFAKFYPGFVGGHCIGVDPYYLTYRAQQLGYNPQVILSGRKLNDAMPRIVAQRVKKSLDSVQNPKVIILGYTFKEDCPDIRNTKIRNLAIEFATFAETFIYDPYLTSMPEEETLPRINFLEELVIDSAYDAVIIAVGHSKFKEMGPTEIQKLLKSNGQLWDLKSIFDINDSTFRL